MAVAAQIVADLILREAKSHGIPISNLKLQKLLYYTELYHLGTYGQPALTDPIKAWVDGPVSPPVLHRFKPAFRKYDTITIVPDEPILRPPQSIYDAVITIVAKYGPINHAELVKMTHSDEPWRHARSTGLRSPTLDPNTMNALAHTLFPKKIAPQRPDITRYEFLRLPIEQRRKILAKQAEDLVHYYRTSADVKGQLFSATRTIKNRHWFLARRASWLGAPEDRSHSLPQGAPNQR